MSFIKVLKSILPYPLINLLKKIRNRITSLELTKIYKTKTGNYCLPLLSYQDIIKEKIINDKIMG